MSGACSTTPATSTGTTTQWPATHCGCRAATRPSSHATRSASASATTVGYAYRRRCKVARQFRRCTRSSQGQGVSPGWTDLYKADLNGQWLRLPKGVDGDVLCLDLEADPRELLIETNEMDNATSIAIRVDGTKVRTVNPEPCR